MPTGSPPTRNRRAVRSTLLWLGATIASVAGAVVVAVAVGHELHSGVDRLAVP